MAFYINRFLNFDAEANDPQPPKLPWPQLWAPPVEAHMGRVAPFLSPPLFPLPHSRIPVTDSLKARVILTRKIP